MAWISVEQSLRYHPKVDRLAKALNIRACEAAGHIVFLWLWASMYAKDGDLSKFSNEEIAKAADYNDGRPPKPFIEALIKSELVDLEEVGCMSIHDWSDGGMKLLNSARERQKRHRERTQEIISTPTAIPDAEFDSLWEIYPNKAGRKEALRHFKASVKTQEDLLKIKSALAFYLKSERVANGYVQGGSRWFNNWHDWISPTESMMKGASNGIATKSSTKAGGATAGDNLSSSFNIATRNRKAS